MSFHFELITPERVVYQREVEAVSLPTELGEITVLPHHAPLVAKLVPGVGRVVFEGQEEEIAVSGGFVVVEARSPRPSDGQDDPAPTMLRVLADSAERGSELDLSVIEAAKQRAEELMTQAVRADDNAYAAAAAALERELARYRVAVKHKGRRKSSS